MFSFSVDDIGSIASAKGNFFDRKKVHSAVDRATRKVLSRFGAFVRTRAISSMLGHRAPKGFGLKSKVSNRQGTSAPGQPPFPHTGLLVKAIFFEYEDAKKTVVIGPKKINRPSPDALVALVKGGTFERMFKGKRRQAHYRPRPFMKPAFDAEMKRRIPGDFKDSVRG